MRLYYMTTLEVVEICILPEWRLKLSTFDKVNDPFELLCADQGDKLQHRVLNECAAPESHAYFLTERRSS
jgi:hypothetical protein